MPAPHFLGPLLAASRGPLVLCVQDRTKPLASTLETAFESGTRRRGLLGHDSLDPDTAFIIAPCSAVHTFGMRFAIDVIFAARDGRVLKIARRVPARRFAAAWGAFAAIEMAAGEAERAGVDVGDVLAVRRGADPAP